MLVAYVLDRLYSLELRLAGFNNKGMKIDWGTSTVSDEVKSNKVFSIRYRTLTYCIRLVSLVKSNMLGQWVMIHQMKGTKSFT